MSCPLVDRGGLSSLREVKRSRSSCLEFHAATWVTWDVDDDGASCYTTSRVVHVESSSGSRIWTCRHNASDQQSRDSSLSLIDVKSLGRPKESSGREEDFQQWSKKTEAFFAGVIMESEMMLEWAIEQATKVTTTAIDLEFLPMDTNCRQLALDAWRRLQKRCDPTTRGRKRNLLRKIFSPGRCSPLELQAEIERWESYVSRYEKKLNDKLDDEIKLAGLEALVPEELETHLILNSHRLQTFEDARLEVVTYVEAKFGFRIRDSKPSDTGSRGHSDPMDVDAVNSLSLVWQRKRVIESA